MGLIRCLLLAMFFMACQAAQAVPVIAWGEQESARGFANLKDRWHSSLLAADAQGLPEGDSLDKPLAGWVWALDDALFKTPQQLKLTQLAPGERWVSRVQLRFSEPKNPESIAHFAGSLGYDQLLLLWPLHRLDRIHVSYRINAGPWHSHSAGDLMPMDTWPFKNQFPAFHVPMAQGTVDLVVEVSHSGRLTDKAVLSSANEYRAQHFVYSLIYGILLGLGLALSFVCTGLAFAMGVPRYLALAAMSLLAVVSLAAMAGILGYFLLTNIAGFNDTSKAALGMLAPSALPLTLVIVLGQFRKFHVQAWCVGLWAALSLSLACISLVVPFGQWREILHISLWCGSFVLTCIVVGVAVLRDLPHLPSTVSGAVAGLGGLILVLMAYTDLGKFMPMLTAAILLTLVSAMLFMYALYMQYRQGRSVLVASKANRGRDLLTGLRNTSGFEDAVALTRLRLKDDTLHAAFFWVQLSPSDALRGYYGDEGYEDGLVRMAAALAAANGEQDPLARADDNAFCSIALMPLDPAQALAKATMMLSRILALSATSEIISKDMRIAIAWMPTHGSTLDALKQRCLEALERTPPEKKIVAVRIPKP